MLLTVKGGNKKQRLIATELVHYVKSLYMPKITTLDITLRIRKFKPEEGAVGWCTYEDNNVNPREFVIDVSLDQSFADFIKTVIHEMIHVKQYALGQMKERYKSGHKILWKDKDYTTTSYSKCPWEREAYRKQETLYEKYMQQQ